MEVEAFLSTHQPLPTEGTLPATCDLTPWEVVAFLAQGGHGEVYQGRHTTLQIPLALKYAKGEKGKRLLLEGQLLAELHHPMFPTVYGLRTIEGGCVLAEELLEPYPLPTRPRAVAQLMYQLCDGLAYLHAQGWIHRDLKPSNLMCRKGGDPVIVDLGLAKRLSAVGDGIPSDLSLLSNGHALGLGTPGYAAPEQLSGDPITTATDIHALGVLMSQCFAGKIPLTWRAILRRATTALPKLRYRTTADLARAIRFRHLWIYLLGLICVLLLGAFSLWRWTSQPEPQPEPPPGPILYHSPQQDENFRYFKDRLNLD